MIEITKKPTRLPKIEIDDELPEGRFYVVGADAKPAVEPERQVVLLTHDGRAELETLAGPVDKEVTTEGTYVAQIDRYALGARVDTPEVRLYDKWSDGWKKAKSASAVILVLTTGLGILSLLLSLALAIWGESGTSAGNVAERSEALLAWVVEPVDGKERGTEVSQRSAEADKCLATLRGGEADVKEVGGVSCKKSSPPPYKDKDLGALIGALLGVIIAALGSIGVARKFGFRQSPRS